ncbi:MAG: hypothetical protein ACK559_26305, partial [bacterium]
MQIRTRVAFVSAVSLAALAACAARTQTPSNATPPAVAIGGTEPGVVGARQLTFSHRFIKAGEAYFSP